MNDFFEDLETGTGKQTNDSSKQIGERIKKYTTLNGGYYDNHIRTNFKLFLTKMISYNLLVLFAVLKYNILSSYPTITFIKYLEIFKTALTTLSMNVINFFVDSWQYRFNLFIREFELEKYFSGYPYMNNLYYYEIPNDFIIQLIIAMIFFNIIFLIKVFYGYYTQRILFKAGILHLYIPIWFYWSFFNRDKNGFFKCRLIRHQKNMDFYPQQSKRIIDNLFEDFDIDTINNKDKLEVITKSQKWFLGWYDFNLLYFNLNDNTSISVNVDEELAEHQLEQIKDKEEDKLEELIEETSETINTIETVEEIIQEGEKLKDLDF